MEAWFFHSYTAGIGPPRLDSISMECGDLRLLRDDWVGYRHRDNNPGPVNERRCRRPLNGQHRQRFFLLLLDPVWLAIILGRGPGTDASKIPSSQSSTPFLIGTGLILPKPACFSHFAVSETV